MKDSTSSTMDKTFKSTLIVAGLIVAGLIIYQAHHVILMTLLGVGLASLVAPILTQVREKFKIPRALTALIFLIVLFLIGVLVTFATGFLVADQLQNLSERFPNIIKNLEKQWIEVSSEYAWAQSWLKDFDVVGTARSGMLRLFKGVQSGMELFTGIGFAIVIALYTSVSAKSYLKSFVSAFPKSKRKKTKETLSLCAQNLRKWFLAQIISMSIVGFLTLVGLWAVGAEYWAVLGLLTMIFSLIPYLGIIIVVIIAALVTFATNPEMLPWVLGVFLITQQIEGNLIVPLVMKKFVELPEVPLLIFMFLMGSWFGILGIFLAAPFFAVLRTLYLQIYLPVVNSK